MKKTISKGIIAATVVFTVLVMAAAFTTVFAGAKTDTQKEQLSSPSAGFSTEFLITTLDSADIYENFLSVTEMAKENIEKQEEIVENISASVEEIEECVETASSYAGEYSDSYEAYEQMLEILDKAEIYLEAAKEAGTYIAADMYTQTVEELEEQALAALEQAEEAAQAQKAEEEAAAEAAAKEAEEEAAAEAAAKEAEEEAAAEAAAKEAEEEAVEEEAVEEAADEAEEEATEEEGESESDSQEESSESSDADATRQALVNYALSFVGVTPYKSGGTSLSGGVDCSGFTMAVFAKYGYSLSHSSSAQASAGRSVSISEIKPGDIVCYSGHVGIYIGNGQIVHAPGSGRYVTTASMYIMSIKSIRRIIE